MATVTPERRVQNERRVEPSIHGMGAIFGRRAFAWGAVWAGAFIASAIQLLCGLLADPNWFLLGGQIPVTGLSLLAGVWYLVYSAAAFMVAGMIAGQTGGSPGNRALHGLVMWAVSSVMGFYAFAIWAGQLNLGPVVIPMAPEAGAAGFGMLARGWMFCGLLIGLCGALFGATRADLETR